MFKKISSEQQAEEAEQINVYVRIRPMRNEFARKSLKLIDRGVAFNYKEKIH